MILSGLLKINTDPSVLLRVPHYGQLRFIQNLFKSPWARAVPDDKEALIKWITDLGDVGGGDNDNDGGKVSARGIDRSRRLRGKNIIKATEIKPRKFML